MIDEMKSIYLRRLAMFRNIEEKKLQEIVPLVKIRQLYPGESVNYGNGQFSKVYFVITGKVKVTELDVENELVKDILNEGEIFGDLQLEGQPKNFEFGQALTENTIICSLNASDFMTILENCPQVAITYAKNIGSKLKRLEDRYTDLMLHDVRSRLVRFIKDWAKVDGSAIDDKIIFQNYLTHNDIAGIISTSRQTVSILFKEMKDSGLLFYNRKLIQLNNSERWN